MFHRVSPGRPQERAPETPSGEIPWGELQRCHSFLWPMDGDGPKTKSRVKGVSARSDITDMTPPIIGRDTDEPAFGGVRFSTIAWQVLPGMILPGIIYFLVSRSAPMLVALAAASSVPLIDAVVRMIRRQPPNAATGLFVLGTGVSVALAFWSGSGMFIL